MTTIVVCADHDAPKPLIHDASVVAVEGLCGRPRQIESVVPEDETSLLLALHGSDSVLGRVQTAVRRMGFDPLGVGMLDLEGVDGDGSLTSALTALMARMASYPGSSPEQVKLLPRANITRRSLLAMGTPAYTGAPEIDEARCVAGDGCRSCANGCPGEALSWESGTIRYEKNSCIACGVCVTTCPTGAVVNPVATPMGIEAEIRSVVASATGTVGVRFVCRSGRAAFEPGWHQVEVPCTGMLTVGWLLAPLVLGAGAATLVPCDHGGCGLGLSNRSKSVLGDAAKVLGAIGVDPARLDGRSLPLPGIVPPSPVRGMFEAGSTQRVIAELHAMSPVDAVFVNLDHTDVGTIAIDAASCTACAMCATVCPTDALASRHDPDAVHIDFDPRSCVACGQCVAVCPEIERGAIRLARGFDTDDWSRGRRVVRHEPTARCELCGRPVAPAAMLDRISTLLGDEHAGTLAVIGSRCIDCRGR